MRHILEATAGYLLLEAALWTSGKTQLRWGAVAFGVMLALNFASGMSARQTGTSVTGIRRAMWVVPGALAVCGVIAFVGVAAGTLHEVRWRDSPVLHAGGYLSWALLQEWMAQSFLFVRLERILRPGLAVPITAALFGIAHLPNIVLVVLTFAMSAVFVQLFRVYRNVYPLGIAHAILGLTLAVSLPPELTHNMRVGIAYFR